MDWSDVRVFLAIARSGSLGAAAKQLGVSHPTVGRRLQVLEQSSGQPIFLRTTQGLVLTDSGEKLLSLAQEMEQSALAIERRLAGDSAQPEGVLRISSADWFACYVLAPVLNELGRRYPLIVPEVIAGHRLFDLARRDADIAFRIVPFTEPDIVHRKLTTLSYGLYAAVGSPDPAPQGDGVGLITMSVAQSHYPDVQWLQQRYPLARTVFTSSSRTVQAQMCAQGQGVAVLPRVLGDQLTALRLIDPHEPPPGRDIWMGYHQDMRRMDSLRALADLASSMIGSQEGS
ncbi:LysR family transcriptional regulator [Pseudomonas bijieensis]|jgi:molybdate transport repressor ModE-like protein|uniref:LysR family transcriptional regulator n=1 Tax=Pseudomonas bijieensis TaxID=2681983 RepID=A0A6N1CAT3_9PSED|nr:MULTISPECIES: LysR family transcriptional regulator [Pseudomonas]QIB08676.1 LysR family transcriptional regulator [Pseudomonas fluorescens]MCD9116568.1 LysR family transcriptional regulator [Pseudomonas bijieensis]PWJ32665.1 molybdate transport repressor ModE-like protein [Pseudomonas sp. 43mfcvi1.1]QKS81087.1 LysR family transcriptional regulator [Pseudomonas bijieensis]UQI28379.1 LysR family transcriptional regulator [Pseudomonas bijieensis]